MRIRIVASIAVLAIAGWGITTAAQRGAAESTRPRAMVHYKVGLEEMRAEDWEKAVKSFQQAIDVDPTFEMAFYSLGRARMAQKRFDEAVNALTRCRDLYLAHAGEKFSNAHEAQRIRRERIIELDEVIRQLRTGPQTQQVLARLRELDAMKRDNQMAIDRGTNMTIENTVPSFVSLSLGSAYFRLGSLADAEREYKVAIAADPNSGEAYQNLAVVFLETGRLSDAERAIASAKKTGFRVNPMLEQDIQKRKKAGSL